MYRKVGGFKINDAFDKTVELLSLKERPTALISMSGHVTIGVLKALKQLELRVPEDISLIGFDEFLYADVLGTPLTTVKQPVEEFGGFSAKTLLNMLNNKNIRKKQIVLKPMLIERDSCRKI